MAGMNSSHFDLLEIPRLTDPPERIVSLVPSLTESLFDLGAGDRLVGITDYCRPPQAEEARMERIGGTKAPDVDAIVQLEPDLVLANKEENGRKSVEMLIDSGLAVWLTFPRSVQEAMDVLRGMVDLLRIPQAAARLDKLQESLDQTTKAALQERKRVFCPIWEEDHPRVGTWWMTFNRETYCHDLLAHCGGLSVFANRERRIPLEADLGLAEPEAAPDQDTRYPRVTAGEVVLAAPEVILLPSEPYAFGEPDIESIHRALEDTPAARTGNIHLVDGSLITWHGTRLALALAELPGILQDQA
jgi:ABC-type Fe3+-hydroxamate transport system substrate-binding protein